MISTEDKLKDETPHFAKLVLSAGTGNLVELFAGSRSIGKVGDELGMNVFSVDWQNFEGINLAIDIGEMKTSDVPFIPDIVWASPDCTTYTIAAISTHRNEIEPKSEYAKKCDQVNQHFIGLIKEWLKVNPNMVFFIENPRGMPVKCHLCKNLKGTQYGIANMVTIELNQRIFGLTVKIGNQDQFATTETKIVITNLHQEEVRQERKGEKVVMNDL